MHVVLTVVLGLLVAHAGFAQSVPPLLNYQGQLTDAGGQPLPTGSYDLTFSIYAAPCGTAPCGDVPVWGPQTIAAAVVDGVFNVVLSNDGDGDPVSAAFGAANRYVEVAVDGGAPILPRQQVLSAPFAFLAENARLAPPPGTVISFAGAAVPAGYLECNGQAVSRAQFSELFAALGTTWGAGDGSTTFNLPDLRGRFIRGSDDGAGRDPDAGARAACAAGGPTGGTVATCQPDAFQGHWHRYHWYGVGSQPWRGQDAQAGSTEPDSNFPRDNQVRTAVTDGVHGNPRVASETRPQNASLRFLVKY